MGVPTTTASTLIATLPRMALARPPSDPGGGVDSVKRDGDKAATPCDRSEPRMKASQIRPKIAAEMDSTIKTLLATRRRA